MTAVVEDTLSFCHPVLDGGLAAWLVGALQFAPWLAAPSFFLDARRGGAGEVVYRLWLVYLKVFVLLVTALQHVVAQSVPNPACTDPFGTTLGMPALGAGVLGAYAVLSVAVRTTPWRGAPPWSFLAVLAGALVVVPAALVADGLHTGAQVLAGLALGGLFGAAAGVLTHTVLVPLALPAVLADPGGLGWFLGTRDTYLRPDAPSSLGA